MYSISAVVEQRQCFQDTFKYPLCWHSYVIERSFKKQRFPGEAKNIFINKSSEISQSEHCCFLLTKNLILFDNITYHQCHDLRTQASTLLYYRLSWEMCVFVSAHYNRICDISLSKRPLSGTSDLSQSEIMSDLILSQDGIDAVWLQIWKLGPDHHYITHHENQHHQTSKI